jgi:DNA-binding PadR family transcriptional regulator
MTGSQRFEGGSAGPLGWGGAGSHGWSGAGPGGWGADAGPGCRGGNTGSGARRFKFGGPHAHGFHGHGPWSRARRGNVRAAILAVLAEEPMHGYQIMQYLEERSGGMWRPSPGSVYPTLQLLEDQGFVKGEEVEGRRVFSLTKEGEAEAQKSKERWGAPWEGAEGGAESPRFKLRKAAFPMFAAVKQVGVTGSVEQIEKTIEILDDARKRIYRLLAGE